MGLKTNCHLSEVYSKGFWVNPLFTQPPNFGRMVTFSDAPKVTFFGHKTNPGGPLFVCILKNVNGCWGCGTLWTSCIQRKTSLVASYSAQKTDKTKQQWNVGYGMWTRHIQEWPLLTSTISRMCFSNIPAHWLASSFK